MTTKEEMSSSSSSSSSSQSQSSSSYYTNTFLSSFLHGIGGTGRNFKFFNVTDCANYNSSTSSSSKKDSNGNGNPASDTTTTNKNDTDVDDIFTPFMDYVTMKFFFYSPNLLWFVMAICIYYIFPYELLDHDDDDDDPPQDSSTSTSSTINDEYINYLLSLFLKRFLITSTYVYCYNTFWHVTLYIWKWRSIPCYKTAPTTTTADDDDANYLTKLCHNVFYTTLGIIQWSILEVIFMYLYQTKRLQYSLLLLPTTSSSSSSSSSHMISSSSYEMTMFVMWCLYVPVLRDGLFYFSHRVVHTKFLYKYIHTIHHRNSIYIEPFSGLCMHPIEHLYYFSASYGPYLLWSSSIMVSPPLHPFILFWCGFHALIAPGASHSGFVDHWGSDIYHYLHHRYYECNYGTPGFKFDVWFNTYRKSNTTTSSSNSNNSSTSATSTMTSSSTTTPAAAAAASTTSAASGKDHHSTKQFEANNTNVINDNNTASNNKATLLGLPENILYTIFGVIAPMVCVWYLLLCVQQSNEASSTIHEHATLISYVLATLPMIVAAILHSFDGRRKKKSQATAEEWWKYYMFPFHNEETWKLTLHVLIGIVFCSIVPVATLIKLLLLLPSPSTS